MAGVEPLAGPWAKIADVCGPCTPVGDGDDAVTSTAVMQDKLLIASTILYAVTGYQWPGEVTETIRPARHNCGCRRGKFGCSRVPEIELPGYPVVDVVEVTIDGVTLDEQVYRVDDRRWLVWQDDEGVDINGTTRNGWPCCQRMKLPLGQVDTFGIEYTYGECPPRAGVVAAATLACEFALACSTDEAQRRRCRLPGRVKAVVRQGVAIELMDNLSLFAEGRTGVPEVDLWVGSLMLGRSRSRAQFIDTQALALQGRKNRRTTWGD